MRHEAKLYGLLAMAVSRTLAILLLNALSMPHLHSGDPFIKVSASSSITCLADEPDDVQQFIHHSGLSSKTSHCETGFHKCVQFCVQALHAICDPDNLPSHLLLCPLSLLNPVQPSVGG